MFIYHFTEEDAIWRRCEQERERYNKLQHRSRSSYEKRQRYARKYRSSSPSDESLSNLGVYANRWNYAFFTQQYSNKYLKKT